MTFRSLLVCVLLAAPALAPGANREIQDLQRDVGLLQQQIKDLQKSQDEKFATVTELARQAIDAANRANTGVAVVSRDVEKALQPLLQQSLAAPMAGINTRLNETGTDVRALQQSVGDLSSVVTRMQQQMNDMMNILKAMSAPPPPAPAQQQASGEVKPSDTKPTMSATDLYSAALSDMRGGKYDLAVQGFTDYLRWYPTERFAPNAQFYIGTIHYQAKNYEQAVKDFDAVLEHYTDNPKTEEAMLYKGRSLIQIPGHRTDAVKEFKQLLTEHPKSDSAPAACEELKNLGMNCAVPAGASSNRNMQSKRKK